MGRSVLAGARSGHCRCGHLFSGYRALSRLSSFWSYCLAMLGDVLIAFGHLGEQVLHDVVRLDRSPARHRRRELAHGCGLEVGRDVGADVDLGSGWWRSG